VPWVNALSKSHLLTGKTKTRKPQVLQNSLPSSGTCAFRLFAIQKKSRVIKRKHNWKYFNWLRVRYCRPKCAKSSAELIRSKFLWRKPKTIKQVKIVGTFVRVSYTDWLVHRSSLYFSKAEQVLCVIRRKKLKQLYNIGSQSKPNFIYRQCLIGKNSGEKKKCDFKSYKVTQKDGSSKIRTNEVHN
jgi:hypothetical protein